MTWQAPPHERGTSLRAALPEEGWREAVVEILQVHDLPSEGAAAFASGSDVVFGAGEHVVKLTHPRWAEELEAERTGLERVVGALAVRIPEPVAHGEISGWPYVVMTRIPGVPLATVWSELDSAGRNRLGRDLGELVRSLHAVPVDSDGGWPEFITRMRAGAVANHTGQGLDAVWAERIEPFLGETWPTRNMPLAFLHTEVLDEHVFVDRREGVWRVSGMLDFADSRIGHPGYEFPALAEFIFKGDAAAFRECLLAYGFAEGDLDHGLSREFTAWSLTHQFGSLPRMLRAVGEPEPGDLDAMARRLYPMEI